jgi:MATE family, multidrug efflux pump
MRETADDASGLDQGLWALCWPLFLYFSVAFSGQLINSWFLGSVSNAAVGAVGALWPLLSFLQLLFSSVAQASCTVATQFIGGRQQRLVPQTYAVMVAFNLLAGATLSIFCWLARHQIPHWLGLTGTAAELATSYLAVMGAGQIISSAFAAYSAIIVSRGETRLMFFSSLLGAGVNVGLNFAFLGLAIWPDEAGSAFAVGLATSTARLLTVGLLAFVVHVRIGIRFSQVGHPNSFAMLRASLSRVLKIGVPSLLEPLSYQGAQLAITVMIATLGTAALAARVYVLNLFVLNMIVSLAISFATQMLIAFQVGQLSFDSADVQFQRSLRAGLLATVGVTATVYLLRVPLLSLLIREPSVREQCLPLLGLALLLEPFRAANIIGTASLRATGDARYSCIAAILLTWGIGVPACYVLGVNAGYGLFGIWLGMVIDEGMRAAVNLHRWRTGQWRSSRIAGGAPTPA